jgi:hypothetical protein
MDKVAIENRGGAWINDRKTADWQDDYKGKMYIAKPGWHWLGVKEQTGENRPAFQVDLRPLDDAAVKQYCSEISVLTKEQAKDKWGKGGGFEKPKPMYTPGADSDDLTPSW